MSFKDSTDHNWTEYGVLALLLVGLMISLASLGPNTVSVEVDAPGERELWRAHYDKGEGLFVFNSGIILSRVQPDPVSYTVHFHPLPAREIEIFAIGPYSPPGRVHISSVAIQARIPFFYPIRIPLYKWTGEQLIEDFFPFHDIGAFELSNGLLALTVTDADPYFIFNGDWDAVLRAINRKLIPLRLAAAALGLILLAGLALFIKSHPQRHRFYEQLKAHYSPLARVMVAMNRYREATYGRLIFSVGIACAAFGLYFLLVGSPIWATNDDVGMSWRAEGLTYASEPSEDLLFIHYLYGRLLRTLYLWNADLPWYALAFLLIIGLSTATLNYALLRINSSRLFYGLALCASIGTVFPALWHLQFTFVAGLAALAGGVLLLSFLLRPPSAPLPLLIGGTLSIVLLSLGYMIRARSLFLVGLIGSPPALALLTVSLRSRARPAFSRPQLALFLLLGVAIMVALPGLGRLQSRNYQSPDWQEWRSLNHAKSEFLDLRRIPYNDATRPHFDEVGWTEIDYRMIMSWQYICPVRFPAERFLALIDALKEHQPEDVYTPPTLASIRAAAHIAWTSMHLHAALMSIVFTCVLIALVALARRGTRALPFLGVLFLAALGVFFYLYVILDRAPLRVMLVVWVSIMWLCLLAWAHLGPPSRERAGNALNDAPLRALCGVLLFFAISHDVAIAKERVVPQVEDFYWIQSKIERWNTRLPPNAIIYSPGGTMFSQLHLPLRSTAYLRQLMGRVISTGTPNQSPDQRAFIRFVLGDEDDLYQALSQHGHVYFMGRFRREILSDYYLLHYGIELTYSDELDSLYLARMVFRPVDSPAMESEP